MENPEAEYRDVSTASLGMSFMVKERGEVVERFIKKHWRIYSNNTKLIELLGPHVQVPDLPPESFVECSGQIEKFSGCYKDTLAKIIWSAIMPGLQFSSDNCDTG